MGLYWSKFQSAFYDDDIHGKRFIFSDGKETENSNSSIPNDAVEITLETYQSLMTLQEGGGFISSDEEGNPIITEQPPLSAEQAEMIERLWRDTSLNKVLNRIDQYEKDQDYPVELRTSPIQSNDEFLKLLNDRKLLSDYPESIDFPFGERPILSGLPIA